MKRLTCNVCKTLCYTLYVRGLNKEGTMTFKAITAFACKKCLAIYKVDEVK